MLALLVVGLLVVTAALLLIGLGVAVGVGLLVGLLLALVAVVATMVASGRNPASGWSISRSGEDPGAMPGLLQEFGQSMARVADVDSGTLTNVVSVGEEATANGVRVEVVAAELRTEGGIVSLVTHIRPPIPPPGHFAEVHVTDDAGTDYVAAAQGSGQSSPSTARYELRFAPAPPRAASELRIQITRFMEPFPETPNAPVEGPWSFTIALPPHAPNAESSPRGLA